MSALIQYRRLFSLEILQEYYLSNDLSLYNDNPTDRDNCIRRLRRNYKISRDFSISPTRDCADLLGNHKLIFKQNGFGFFVGCKVSRLTDGTFVPFIALNRSFSLRFAVSLQNQYVFNFSNLSFGKNSENKDHFLYYFSNRANNFDGGGNLYLSQSVPRYDALSAYEAGEIVLYAKKRAKPSMFEAIEDTSGEFNPEKWLSLFSDLSTLPQFVSRQDLIVSRPKIFRHKVESAAQEKLSFNLFDYKGKQIQTMDFETVEAGKPLYDCELKLTNLPSAFYSFEVKDINGISYPELGLRFFLDDDIYNQKPLALFEIFHAPDGSLKEYSLIDQDNGNRLLSPVYRINLKNRSTFWRYYYSDKLAFTSSQVEVYKPVPEGLSGMILVSTQPYGLTHLGRRVEIKVGRESVFLPNPSIGSIFPERGRIYSEINMGGGFGPPDTG